MTLPPGSHHSETFTSSQVHVAAREILQETFADCEINGYQYTQNAVWDVWLYASVHRVSMQSACKSLAEAPSSNWMYTALKEGLLESHDLASLERRANDLLHATFPPRLTARAQQLAIDMVLIPYYGKATTKEIRRSQAKKSTTTFFCFASAYLIKKNKRVTLCCTFVRPEDRLLGVLTRVLQRTQTLGIRVKRLYLDRGFAHVDVLRHLQQQPWVSVVALPKKGTALKALQRGKRSCRTPYTMISPQEGAVTFPLWIACRYGKGRAKKHGVQYLFFAVLGECRSPILQGAQEYRRRFGIASSYRIMHRVRAKTTSRNPELRLLLVALAFFLVNLWVWYKWYLLLVVRQRALQRVSFPLDIFCHFVMSHIEHIYGKVTHIKL